MMKRIFKWWLNRSALFHAFYVFVIVLAMTAPIVSQPVSSTFISLFSKITDNESTNEENAVVFVANGNLAGGVLQLESDGDYSYNPSTGIVSALGFHGDYYNVKKYGAAGDGVTDDTTAIQAAIDASSAGDTIFFPQGTYYINTAGGVDFDKQLTVIGHGATFTVGNTVGNAYFFDVSGNDCKLIGFKIDGTTNLAYEITQGWDGSAATNRVGIYISGNHCLVDSVTVEDTIYGIHFDGTTGGEVRNCVITNATVKADAGYGNDSAGVYLDNSDYVRVHDNYISGFGATLLGALSPTKCHIYSNHILNSDEHGIYISSGEYLNIYDNNVSGFDVFGIKVNGTHDNNVHNNRIESTVTDASSGGIAMEGRSTTDADGFNGQNFNISNNIIQGKYEVGIQITHDASGDGDVDNFSITGNTIKFTEESIDSTYLGWGIKITSACLKGNISNNTIHNSTRGLVIQASADADHQYCDNLSITGNVVADANGTITGTYDKTMGMIMENCRYANVVGNTFASIDGDNDTSYGIFLATVTYSRFIGNDCGDHQGTASQDYGIYESTGCDYNYYLGNYTDRDDGTAMTDYIYLTGSNSKILLAYNYEGNQGIHTDDPNELLDVDGDGVIETLKIDDTIEGNGDTDTKIDFATADKITITVGNEQMITITEDGSQDIIELGDDGDIDIKLSGGADGALFVQGSSGNIGVNTTDPNHPLDVDGTVQAEKYLHRSITVTAAGPTDNLDVDDADCVLINTNGNNVTLGGLTNGDAGQLLYIAVIDATNNAILEHAEGTGNQDIYLSDGADETITAGYGGWLLQCNGTHWYEVTAGGGGNVEDDVYGAGWNGDGTNAPSQNSVYDYLVQFDADADGDFTDEGWFPGGGVTPWDDIADPDADATIAFAGYEEIITSTLDEAAHTAFTISHTDADVTAATTIFKILGVDNDDADLTFFHIEDDSGGTPDTIFKVDTGVHVGADDEIAHLYVHDAGTIVLYDDSDDTSVTLGPVGDGTTTLAVTGVINATSLQVGGQTVYYPGGAVVAHEYGGIEADISAIADGGILVGTGAGTMGIRASALTAGAAGFFTHELGGLEADVSAYDGFVYITGGVTSAKTQNAGTDVTADLEEETHASEHAVSGGDTVFPADPDADQILMWDDDPGALVWTTAATGDMLKATYDIGDTGGVNVITTVDSTYASDYVVLVGAATGQLTPKTDGALTYDSTTGQLAATSFLGSGASLTAINGENISDDTIDVDSLDWGAFTDLGEGGAVTWGNCGAGELGNDSVINEDIDDDGNFVFTGNWDFGGGDLEFPQASPGAPDADGEVELDFTDGSVVIQHGSAHAELSAATDVVVGKLIHSFAATLAMPDLLQSEIDNWMIKTIKSSEFPHGIVITEITLTVSSDTSYEINIENWDDHDTINGANGTIDTVTYTAPSTGEVTEDTITYSTIAAGQIIQANLPTTDVSWINIDIQYYEPIA